MLGGCSARSDPEPPAGGGPSTSSRSPTPSRSASSAPPADALLRTTPWKAAAGEVSPQVKLRAVKLLETVASWSTATAGLADARQRLRERGYDPDLVEPLAGLVGTGKAATAQVVMAQYGGILATSASVLAVLNQWVLGTGGKVVAGGTTVDIRLAYQQPDWVVTDVFPANLPRPAAQLSKSARRVLNNPRITLPFAAAADVRSGQIHDSVLGAMNALSADFEVDVSVLKSGHPINVFGTTRQSNHTDGRAVDVWAIDNKPVIDQANQARVARFMRAAAATGTWQVGGPINLDGDGTAFFADDTHQDHIHMGFTT